MIHTVQMQTKPPSRKIVTYSHEIGLNSTQQCSTDATFAQASDKTITQNKTMLLAFNQKTLKYTITFTSQKK